MKSEFQDDTLTVFLTGHIDSSNVDLIEKEIRDDIEKTHPASLVFDAETLEYISSAGLRVMLKLRKEFENLCIINVSASVYEILDMTGFTEILTVEKAYRRYDVTGCEVIGEGANGTVYRVARDTIVKVYKDANALNDIKRERELARTAFVLGIPTAIPFDVVKVGETYGSVFELLNAKSFDELMKEDESNLEFVAQHSVKIMKIIHSTKAPENLPRQRDTALQWVSMVEDYFSDEQYQKLGRLIADLPEDGYMLHGDFHIKNMMLQNDETLLIDMDTLCTGHPIYELAFMFNAYKGFGIVDSTAVEDFLGISVEMAYRLFRRSLELYLDTDDSERLLEVEEKAALIGYLRVMRRAIRLKLDATDEGKKLVSACRSKLIELIEKTDTLTF